MHVKHFGPIAPCFGQVHPYNWKHFRPIYKAMQRDHFTLNRRRSLCSVLDPMKEGMP